jgi:hypothetical protein
MNDNDKKKYIKLCSATLNPIIGGTQRVLINDDHILLVLKRGGMIEEYRRFFLKDICRITVYKTWGRTLSIMINSIVLALFLLPTFVLGLSNETVAVAYVFGFLAIVALTLLLVDIIRGPTSKTLITTLNSEDSIIITKRFNKTLKVLRKIRPMIEAAQGGVTRNETIDRLLGSTANPRETQSNSDLNFH